MDIGKIQFKCCKNTWRKLLAKYVTHVIERITNGCHVLCGISAVTVDAL